MQLLMTEFQHGKPVPNLPEPRQEREGDFDQPDGWVEGSDDGEGSSEQLDSKVPFAALHHAEVLVEGELAHGIECEPVHDFIDHNRLFRGSSVRDVLHEKFNLPINSVSV